MAETGIRGFWTRWREERIPFLAALIEPWAYTGTPTLRDAEQAAYNSGVIGQMKGEPYTRPQLERNDEDRRCAEAWRRGWRRSWEVEGAA